MAVDANATLRIAAEYPLTSFDPVRAPQNGDLVALALTYDRLLHMTPGGEPQAGLATAWEFSDDGTALELTLREGVEFHDGTPFDADVVQANIERGKTYEGSVVAASLEVVESVEVVGSHEVRLLLSGPAAHLPLVLTDRPGIMVSPAAFDAPDLDRAPAGSGMYRVTDNDGGVTIVYERNEDYWDSDAAAAAEITFTAIPDPDTRLNAVRSGEADIALTIDPRTIDSVGDTPLQVIDANNLQFYHVQLNRSYEPLTHVEVRQALQHAIDRNGINDGIFFGRGEPSTQIFPTTYFAFDPDTGADSYPYDPDRARDLLAQGGYPDGFDLTLLTQQGVFTQLGEIVQAQLGEVGIRVELVVVETGTLGARFYGEQEGHAMVAPWNGRPDPAESLSALFGADSFFNPGGGTSETLDELLPATYVPGEERTEALRAASAVVTEEALAIPILYPVNADVLRPDVVGWQEEWIVTNVEFRGVGVASDGS